MRDIYLPTLFVVEAYLLFTVIANITYFRRATRTPVLRSGPLVSVIVPARNEEHNITRCVESLLKQDYTNFEVIVVDDDSDDATASIVTALAEGDRRLRLVCAGALPPGWLGKPWALSQGAAVARGEVLLLADADTALTSHSLSWAITNLVGHKADFLSGYLQQEYGSFGEDLVVPTMYAAMLVVPFALLPRARSPRVAFAVGQYVVMRRDALRAMGGFEAIHDSLTDDMTMATLLKAEGCKGVFLDARGAGTCRLYRNYRDAFNGIKRSIYGSVGGHPVSALAIVILVMGLILGPPAWMLASYLRFGVIPPTALIASVVFGLTWALVLWDRKAPVRTAVLYPVVFFNLLLMLGASMLSTGFGEGAEWKGRLVRLPRHFGRPPEVAGNE